MNNMEFGKFTETFMEEQKQILKVKGADYSDVTTDRLSNFRAVGYLQCVAARMVWCVYMLKHVFAILTWVRTGKVHSEELRGRFLDLANYAILGAALATEEE
jgi:hypothetical protein